MKNFVVCSTPNAKSAHVINQLAKRDGQHARDCYRRVIRVTAQALGGADSLVEWRYFDLEACLYGDAVLPKEGSLAVPQGPGLGIEPDPEVIRRYRIS
jgi:L-alanine-DL-glutamate epimerase-like enolase superfamily enzyme